MMRLTILAVLAITLAGCPKPEYVSLGYTSRIACGALEIESLIADALERSHLVGEGSRWSRESQPFLVRDREVSITVGHWANVRLERPDPPGWSTIFVIVEGSLTIARDVTEVILDEARSRGLAVEAPDSADFR